MAIFQWKGIEGNTASSGEIEAFNTEDAKNKLQARKVVVTNLVLISGEEKEGSSLTGQASGSTGSKPQEATIQIDPKIKVKKVKLLSLMIFTKKFATMVEAGLPINKTLRMLEEQQEEPNFQWVVRTIREGVEGGAPLSSAFAAFPSIFDTIYVNLIKAGESSGKLTNFLHKLVIHLEKSQKIRSKLKGAFMYPTILLSVAIAVISIMMIWVVPVFQDMFGKKGGSLPGPTQMVVNISEFVRDPMGGGVLAGVLVGLIFLIKYLKNNNPDFRKKFDLFVLKMPVIGEVVQKSTLARIAMIQGNLAMAGVPITQALQITEQSIPNTVYREAFEQIKTGIATGNTLSSLYASCDIIPATFYQMLAVGEETGKMDEMFDSTALYYEEEFDIAVDRLTESLEPIMIISMGLTVGFIIVAMYMPIFQMGKMV